jgi:hypothetical protein
MFAEMPEPEVLPSALLQSLLLAKRTLSVLICFHVCHCLPTGRRGGQPRSTQDAAGGQTASFSSYGSRQDQLKGSPAPGSQQDC